MSLFDRQDEFTEIKEDSDVLILPHRWEESLNALEKFAHALERNSVIKGTMRQEAAYIEAPQLMRCYTIFSRRSSYEWSFQRALTKYKTMEALQKRTLGIGVSFPIIDAPEHHPYLELPFIRLALDIIDEVLDGNPFIFDGVSQAPCYLIAPAIVSLRQLHTEYDIESVIIGVDNAKKALSRFYPNDNE
jgi:hypothetical protein